MKHQHAILVVQALNRGEATPTDLIDRIRTKNGIKIGLASMYAQLEIMEQAGQITSRVGTDEKGRTRRWYTLVPGGVQLDSTPPGIESPARRRMCW